MSDLIVQGVVKLNNKRMIFKQDCFLSLKVFEFYKKKQNVIVERPLHPNMFLVKVVVLVVLWPGLINVFHQ